MSLWGRKVAPVVVSIIVSRPTAQSSTQQAARKVVPRTTIKEMPSTRKPNPRKKTVRPKRQRGAEEAARLRDAFSRYLASECQLSPNTVAAYRRDLSRFYQWLAGRQLQNLKVSELSDYPAWLTDTGLASSSVARHVVSLKVFFRYLQLEGVLNDNQAALLTSRKLWQRVPTVLTAVQVDKLLTAPQRGEPLWRRDRAVLEMLYATGARVSELSNLLLRDLHLAERKATGRTARRSSAKSS